MAQKTVLVAGASGLVGYAALKHFAGAPETDVIAVSRRRPPGAGARHLALDLSDAAACRDAAETLQDVTHLVYAALFELPGLVEGWRDEGQIVTNDRMLRNLMGPLLAAAPRLQHVTLLQGTKAYGTLPPALALFSYKLTKTRRPLAYSMLADLIHHADTLVALRNSSSSTHERREHERQHARPRWCTPLRSPRMSTYRGCPLPSWFPLRGFDCDTCGDRIRRSYWR